MAITPQYLNDDQLNQVNEIFARIVKKYSSFASDTVKLAPMKQITLQTAVEQAKQEMDIKRAQILETYTERIRQINIDAAKRGLSFSSIILSQLEKAETHKNNALEKLEDQQYKLANKIFADNQKLCLSIEREKASSKSRSIRDFVAMSKMKNTVPYSPQTLIDEELYHAYLEWLLQYKPDTASSYVQSNACFAHNMTSTNYSKLLAEVKRRNGGN